MGAGWLEKKEAFEEKMVEMGMDEVGSFDKEDERGALLLTYSGSLVSLGPMEDNERNVEYTSIGFRHDVPASLSKEGCSLAGETSVDKPMLFEKGPIKATSPIFKIVVCPESLSFDEQEELVNDATTMIVDTFIEKNKEIIPL